MAFSAAGLAYCSAGTAAWRIRPGGRYYTVRNNSSVIAFKVGEGCLGARGAAQGAERGSESAAPLRFGYELSDCGMADVADVRAYAEAF